MEKPNTEQPQVGQKAAKFEIGKILAVVAIVVVIAGVASAFISSTYFKGEFDRYSCRADSVCGDNVVCPETEQCDDGNKTNNDLCNNQCELQSPMCHYNQSGSYKVLWIDDYDVDALEADNHSSHVNDIRPITDLDNDGDFDEDDCNLSS